MNTLKSNRKNVTIMLAFISTHVDQRVYLYAQTHTQIEGHQTVWNYYNNRAYNRPRG